MRYLRLNLLKLYNFQIFLLVLLGTLLLSVFIPACSSPPRQILNAAPASTPDLLTLDGQTLSLAWTYDTAGPINLPPLRLGSLVIVAPEGGALTAIDVETGALAWTYDPPAGIWERGLAGSGDTLFIGLRDASLVALRVSDREVRWRRELGINVQAPPFILGNTVFVPTTFVGPGLTADPEGRARLFALDAQTGEQRWSFESRNYILQTPYAEGETVYVAGSYRDPEVEVDEGGPMRLYALAARDGSLRWTYESVDGYVKSLYATPERVIYIAYQDFVSGLDANQGTLIWRRDTGNWVPALSGVDEVVYFGSANTVVHAWRVADGESVWEFDIPTGTFNYLLGEPVRIANDLYFLTQQGEIIALDAVEGNLLWSLETGITSRVGLTVSGGWLFIGDQHGRVYAYTSP